MSVLMPALYCFNYYSFFAVSFEVRKYQSSNCILFKTALALQDTLEFYMNMKIGLSNSAKKKKKKEKTVGIFDRNYAESENSCFATYTFFFFHKKQTLCILFAEEAYPNVHCSTWLIIKMHGNT